MFAILARIIFKIIGWKITGNYDNTIDKKIIIVAPHTSNWDFPLGLLARAIIKDKIQFVGKSSLFKPLFGWFMRWMGGIPVDRSKSTNFVSSVAEEYKKRDKMTIVIAPEGTRRKVEKFKTGFYYIAKLAEVPIIMVKFDYKKKEINFADPFWPTENAETDLDFIQNYYKGVKGKVHSNSF